MVGRQLPFFSVLVPFWLVAAFSGMRGMIQVWPAILVTGLSFAIPQYLISNFVGPYLVDIGASVASMAVLILFLRVWRPKEVWTSPKLRQHDDSVSNAPVPPLAEPARGGKLIAAWMPWAILCAVLTLWGSNWYKEVVNDFFAPAIPVDGLHNLVERAPPVVAAPAPEAAMFRFTFLSYTGTGILVTAIISGLIMGFGPLKLVKEYGRTIWALRFPLITIVCMLAVGTLTRYSGIDATLGLAFAATGLLYPFFGTLLGWLGVAATGSDTSSNILFGGLQKITSEQLGISPVLMAAANSSGGVMGKMIDTQSIVVASTATGWFGHENRILRFVFLHSIVLVSLVGALVMLQAYVWPFTAMVVPLPP
jgi:lactate permease